MPVILTACTQRKRVTHNPFLCARDLPKGVLKDVAHAWDTRRKTARSVGRAQELYSGRSFVEATKAAQAAQAALYIVSAGLGLVHGNDEVPSYNLTVSKGGPDCVLDKIEDGRSEADWWMALGAAQTLHEVFDRSDNLIVLALPSPYLRMIAPALSSLTDEACDRIRIVGGRDAPDLDPRLELARLPYDDRLDGPQSPLPGTKSDFASRSARHFVEEILLKAPRATAKTHRELVEAALSTWTRPVAKAGARMSDLELKSVFRDQWARAGGRSTKLLRILRDELNIACEQKRFSRLAGEIREERTR
ncbi:DUF6884 domain-containing protein [Neorhizobium galegae]|uniref:DUF6884 domain-containing protein n=1 Tax=Neorhizobium galegae TaxID=399 RepID=UPI000620E473|nr:DUF6884 domain-containing protein [Neorhizobium galegae]CDZ54354.1 Hypothetical protein NGAL_HAMBI2427_55960 [Neorhizobium galegae bv. orientalis]